MGCRANLTSTIWRNMITMLFYIEELMYCSSKGIERINDYVECTMLYKSNGIWNDGMLITTYFQILE